MEQYHISTKNTVNINVGGAGGGEGRGEEELLEPSIICSSLSSGTVTVK